jgi:hypothetical protein
MSMQITLWPLEASPTAVDSPAYPVPMTETLMQSRIISGAARCGEAVVLNTISIAAKFFKAIYFTGFNNLS